MTYRQHKSVSKYRKIEHALTEKEFTELTTSSCAYCNKEGGGIDRIDPSLGYLAENCVPSCKRCNARKSIYERFGVEFAVQRTLEMAYRNEIPPPSQRIWAAGFGWLK